MRFVTVAASLTAVLLGGCTPKANLPTGQAAYQIFTPANGVTELEEYTILPFDRVSVNVYREPDLSIADVEVDSSGKFAVPLIGAVTAAGLTTTQLAESIREQLAGRYVKDPRVSVNVITAASRRIIVEGSVNQPGVYDFKGETTLLGALALARGPTQVAALDEVAIFRRLEGQVYAAKFDVGKIRRGEQPDPELNPNDTVVVGFSNLKSAWRDALQALPALGLFLRFQ